MFATALAIVVMSRSLATEALHDVWNPVGGPVPLHAADLPVLVDRLRRIPPAPARRCSWRASSCSASSRTWRRSLGALAVGAAPACVVSLQVATARPGCRAALRGAPASVRRWALAALLVARRRCWAPPVIDQIEGQPGEHHARSRGPPARTTTHARRDRGLARGRRSRSASARGGPTDPASPWQRKIEVREAPDALATVSTVLAALRARRRRRARLRAPPGRRCGPAR